MKIRIIENSSMVGDNVKVPQTLKRAIELTGFSKSKVERLIIENGELQVQNGDYWFTLKEEQNKPRIYTEIRISHKTIEDKEKFEKMLSENIKNTNSTDKVDYIRSAIRADHIMYKFGILKK
jgi:hypothetical protein